MMTAKRGLLLILLLLSPIALSVELFNGTVEDFSLFGSTIVIDGEVYKITNKTQISINGVSADLSYVKTNRDVQYALNYEAVGQKELKLLKYNVSDAEAKKIFNH